MNQQELEELMRDFKESRGWKEIQSWLEPIIKQAELRLLGDEGMSPEEQKLIKRDWKNHKKFYDYPDFIVAKSKAGMKAKEENLDPYE